DEVSQVVDSGKTSVWNIDPVEGSSRIPNEIKALVAVYDIRPDDIARIVDAACAAGAASAGHGDGGELGGVDVIHKGMAQLTAIHVLPDHLSSYVRPVHQREQGSGISHGYVASPQVSDEALKSAGSIVVPRHLS